MKLRSALLILAMLVSSVTALAQSVPTPGELFLRGKSLGKQTNGMMENHEGEELDLSTRRPTVNLEGTVFAEKYAKPGTTLWANFYHVGKFYVARVPDQGVKRVFLQIWYFATKGATKDLAAHSLLRFEMDPARPVELVAFMPEQTQLLNLAQMNKASAIAELPAELTGAQFKLRNVALSAEAQWSKKDPKKMYGILRGQMGAFMTIIRFVSMESRLMEFFKSGNPVSQVELDPEGVDLDKVLKTGLAKSQREGISIPYRTFIRNCTTIAFEIVEQAIEGIERKTFRIREFMRELVPATVKKKLSDYGREVMPVQQDTSLIREAALAHERVYLDPKSPVRGTTLEAKQLANLELAESMILRAGVRLRTRARTTFLGCPQAFGSK
ncbi:MAG: hypothetical protein AAB250_11540 [Bdellovibrionota bacterium]